MDDIYTLRGDINPEDRGQVRQAAFELLGLAVKEFVEESLHTQPWAWLTREDADVVGNELAVAVEEYLDELRAQVV